MVKINIGAGNDIREGYINHDITKLKGIDVVHNLNIYPWPWDDNSCDELLMNDVLEHLDSFILAMEEAHRILKHGGILVASVPYWNSANAHIDPTHKKGFHEHTFRFFDPNSHYCQERPYYTTARFTIEDESFVLSPFVPYIQLPFLKLIIIRNPLLKKIIGLLGNLISNVILDLNLKLKKTQVT